MGIFSFVLFWTGFFAESDEKNRSIGVTTLILQSGSFNHRSSAKTFWLIFLLELLDFKLHFDLVTLGLKHNFCNEVKLSSTTVNRLCLSLQCWLPAGTFSQRRTASSPAPELSGSQSETSFSAGTVHLPAALTPD